MRYTITPLNGNMSVRPAPTTNNVPFTIKLLLGQTASGDNLFETSDGKEKWLQCPTLSNGWVAVVHLGIVYCRITDAQVPEAEEDAIFGFIYHDFDLFRKSRPTLLKNPRGVRGLPETTSILDLNGFVRLTEEIQWLWFDWCRSLVSQPPEQDRSSFLSLTSSDRAFTNRYGSNKKGIFPACACYPCGTNLDKEDMRLFPLLCGGAYIKIIGGMGSPVLRFETMNSLEDMSKYSPQTHPWLFYSPTNSVRDEIWWDKQTHVIVQKRADGTYPPRSIWSGKWTEQRVEPFPQFQNKSIVPIITRGAKYNRIESHKVRILPKGSPIPSPFVS